MQYIDHYNKFTCPNGINGRILKEGSDSIAYSLHLIYHFFNYKIPEDWKTASVVPVFKKGNWDNLGNYRC